MANIARTDLASEAARLWRDSAGETGELQGVKAGEEHLNGFSVSAVEILNELGEQALGKPRGRYYTLELPSRFERGAEDFPSAAQAISSLIARCADLSSCANFLIAALGNPDITPDALGPLAASNIIVTRHLKKSAPEQFKAFRTSALCRTGVLGTTGIESAIQIKTLCNELKPDCVIAVDALAGLDVSRLCRTVQICGTGISPGSGVGNDREALNQESLGVPVIALGMPTVIDAGIIANQQGLQSMFVTPRDIDSSVRSAGRLIGYGINLALHPGLTVADIDMLVG